MYLAASDEQAISLGLAFLNDKYHLHFIDKEDNRTILERCYLNLVSYDDKMEIDILEGIPLNEVRQVKLNLI